MTKSTPLNHRVTSVLLAASMMLLVSCGSESPAAVPATSAPTATPDASTPVATPTPMIATPAATPVIGPTVPLATPVPSPAIAIPETPEQLLAEEFLANEAGVYGFVVLEADGMPVVSINSTTPFVTASLYKLILMADIYQRIEMGSLALDQTIVLEGRMFEEGEDNYFTWDQVGTEVTIREYLFAVGAWSSNVAARTLLGQTSPGELRNTALAIGMTDTYLFTELEHVPTWPPEPGADAPLEEVNLAIAYLEESAASGPINITTPLDMARYQLAIANDTLISPWVSEQVALVLQEQAIRDRIPALIEGDVFVINKPGNLVDAVNDVGVLYLPAGHRAVAILSEAIPNTDRATYVEQRLALIATGWMEYVPTGYDSRPIVTMSAAPTQPGKSPLPSARRRPRTDAGYRRR